MNDQELVEQRLARAEQRLKELEYALRTTNAHVEALEDSIIFQILRRVGRPILDARTRARRWLAGLPFGPKDRTPADAYAVWAGRRVAAPLPSLTSSPSFTILLQASDAPQELLDQGIVSVQAQTYGCWDLCLCSGTTQALSDAHAADRRIRRVVSGRGPIAALNDAANSSRSDYVLVLQPGDRLTSDALHRLAEADPAELIYADEDLVDDAGRPLLPLFKPDWSPDLLLSCMYLGRMVAISRAAWEAAGGLRLDCGGGELYDLALRITDAPAAVRHVSGILLRARGPLLTPPGAHEHGALEDALRRRGADASVETGNRPGSHHVRWRPSGDPLATIVICSRSSRLLDQCLSAVSARTGYPNREIVVVQHLGTDDAALERVIQRHGAHRVSYSGPFHFSRMNNLGAQAASGEILVFLNDDTEPLCGSWLDRLIGHAQRPDVGVVGAQLLYPSGTIQHAGIVVGIGDGCGHIGRGAVTAPYWPWLRMTRDVAAVTGACLAIRTALFRELQGFDEIFPSNYNDADLCLRAREAGHRVVYDPAVVLTHYEAQSRRTTVTLEERQRWYRRWESVITVGDPFYSRELTQRLENLSLAE